MKTAPYLRTGTMVDNAEDLFTLRGRVKAPKGLIFSGQETTPLLKLLEYPIDVYIRTLRDSVQIVEMPKNASSVLHQAMRDCRRFPRPSVLDNQHSLEFRFPYTLVEMQKIAEYYAQPAYNLLWKNSTFNQEPLFYYLDYNHYFVVQCIYNRRGKESWEPAQQYTAEIVEYLAHKLPQFQLNKGVDFLVPASHPKAGPYGVKTNTISAFQRQTFLRTDFDFSGHSPRDIIVPYYVPIPAPSPTTSARKPYLLFFAGGKNPPGGLREQLERAFASHSKAAGSHDILFTTDPLLGEVFESTIQSSVFCAAVRGDTASSSRLFSIIASGCIPVIISDWLSLPFESIIDYRPFTLRFPESIVHNVGLLIAQLRAVSPTQIAQMHVALEQAKPMLLFPPITQAHSTKAAPAKVQKVDTSSAISSYPLLNPVTLTMVEMIMRRKQHCDKLRNDYYSRFSISTTAQQKANETSNMCIKLYARFAAALSESRTINLDV